jgi:site-specific DNA-methyltransferase (adenine-specific)
MEDETFLRFLSDSFSAADGVMRPGAAFYIWHADSEGYNFRKACKDIGWHVRQCLVWVKNTLVMGRQDYQWKHEPCLYGWAEGTGSYYEEKHEPCLYGWTEGAGHSWYSDRKQSTVLEFDRPTRSALHPTMKPVALFAYLIGNSSKAGDNVLDSFGGSGTTVMACEQMGRNAYLCELDPRYCDVIIKRWEDYTGEKAVLLDE